MTSEIILFDKKNAVENKCSFCKTPESQVKKLMGNDQGKFICDKCVVKCKDLMVEDIVA